MRKAIDWMENRRESAANAGLLLQRYAARAVPGNEQEKPALYAAAIAAAGRAVEVYRPAFARRLADLKTLPHFLGISLPTAGRLGVGLGAQNVLEVGLALNHTYGLPLIPGSSLKGVANHYCHSVWGAEFPEYLRVPEEAESNRGRYHRFLFGTTADAGAIVFHDAWITPETAGASLKHDVVTPHHPHWMDEQSAPPSDFDSPVPVRFLSVDGTFHLAVSWNGPEHQQAANWTKRALLLLESALDDWGAGGKTNAGYGRLGEDAAAEGPKAADAPADGRVEVTVLEAMPKSGKNAFRVQEEGKNRGMLVEGVPEQGLPQIGDKIRVIWETTSGTANPRYRWSPVPAATPVPKGKPRGGGRR